MRPSALDAASTFASKSLESVGIRAGIPVFAGTRNKQRSIIRARCIVVTGTDRGGRRTKIHPRGPCPRTGFLWRPVIYDNMIFHWTGKIDPRLDPANLRAMGDHFCTLSPDPLQRVEITKVMYILDYETGRESRRPVPIGTVQCRDRRPDPNDEDRST